jgi:hypothetical protein
VKKFFTILFIVFFLLFWMVGCFQACTSDLSYTPDYDEENEFDEYDSIASSYTHKRSWQDYYNEQLYSMKYAVPADEREIAQRERDGFNIDHWETDNDYWRQVYFGLYDQNKTRLNFVQDSLQHLRDSLQLDRDDFARMVVSFVQDIPYHYVVPDSCDAHHQDFPCLPNVKYGILSPVEFLNTLHGDCDTRTVLLFTLLRNFGYEPIIINSTEYLHSMLALDIPVSGDYLEYKGRRYAFWETTNVGWLAGMLPPDMNNKTYWNVILDL